jgi:hypothetical protein
MTTLMGLVVWDALLTYPNLLMKRSENVTLHRDG